MPMSDKKEKEPEKEGLDRLKDLLDKAEKDPKKGGPPIYEPGSYPTHLIAALAYVIPIVDSADLGKYMFEAYPDVGTAFNTIFGPIAAVYNGVPFLPFAIFFGMSYICRAPTFPVEVRFHVAQAFMLSIIQFVPSLLFGLMEKAGVPGMAVLYNTVFLWVMSSSLIMQLLLLNPIAETKNPFIVNVVGWSMRYMVRLAVIPSSLRYFCMCTFSPPHPRLPLPLHHTPPTPPTELFARHGTQEVRRNRRPSSRFLCVFVDRLE